MLDITVQLLANFARLPDGGVNDMAQSIPRKNIDPLQPDDPAPPLVAVVDDVTDKGVAANLDPSEVPALMIFGDSTAEVSYRGYKIAREVSIAAAFITAEDADPIESARVCGYILRGARLTFGRYNTSAGKPYRELNGIKVMEITKSEETRITAAVGRRKMWGFLDIRATVVETLQ